MRAGERWLPFVVLSVVFAAMTAFSWGKWPDVLVDFGHEVYVPWRLREGRLLGVDFPWVATGPLSPYFNALLFWLFGTSLRTLFVANLCLLGLIAGTVYGLLRDLSTRWSATLAGVIFLTVFGFAQYVPIGNYNYVAPYSHGITHGLLLALISLWRMHRYVMRGDLGSLVGSGLAFGCTLLTKPEIVLANAVALVPSVLLALTRAPGGARAWARIGAFLAVVVAPVLVCFLCLAPSMPAKDAALLTLSPWVVLFGSNAAKTIFYAQGSGLDMPAANLRLLGVWAGIHAMYLLPALLLDRLLARRPVVAALCGGVVALAMGLALFRYVPFPLWAQAARPLPLFVVCGAVAYVVGLARFGRGGDQWGKRLLGLNLSLFAGVLLLKMLLNARLYHYGFVLAMPATLLTAVWSLHSIPHALGRGRGDGLFFRMTLVTIWALLVVAHLQASAASFGSKVHQVGFGADAFLADERGRLVQEMLATIEREVPADKTLSILPEGVMIDYLTRRATSIPYLAYMADSIAFFGGERPLLDALRRQPPDFVLLVHRDSSEHGARFFGVDYARDSAAWIARNYREIRVVGAPPFRSRSFGMALLKYVPSGDEASAPQGGAR